MTRRDFLLAVRVVARDGRAGSAWFTSRGAYGAAAVLCSHTTPPCTTSFAHTH